MQRLRLLDEARGRPVSDAEDVVVAPGAPGESCPVNKNDLGLCGAPEDILCDLVKYHNVQYKNLRVVTNVNLRVVPSNTNINRRVVPDTNLRVVTDNDAIPTVIQSNLVPSIDKKKLNNVTVCDESNVCKEIVSELNLNAILVSCLTNLT